MEIKLNGKAHTISQAPLPLLQFLREEGLDPELPGVAVAINFSVIPRSEWPEVVVQEGDAIELITARQGG